MQQLEVKPAEMNPSMVDCLAIKQCDDIFECYQNARHRRKSAMAALEVIIGKWWRIFDPWLPAECAWYLASTRQHSLSLHV